MPEAVWPVRVIIGARALTIGLAFYLALRTPGESAPFAAVLGSLLTFDVYVALKRRRESLSGLGRAFEVTVPRALATTKSLVMGLLVGLSFGLLEHLGLPYVVAAVSAAGISYSLAERTPNNLSAYIGLFGAIHLFERVAELPAVVPTALLPAAWPVARSSFTGWLVALAVGLGVGTLLGFVTRLGLPRAYRSRQSQAYPLSAEEARREEKVRQFWEAFDRGDFPAAGALLAEDCEVVWPNTREVFRGRDRFIAANANYPGRWTIQVERILRAGDGVVSVVGVSQEGLEAGFSAVSFFEFEGEAIQAITEYWGDVEEPPGWRRDGAWSERY